jgi:hypothetical protein
MTITDNSCIGHSKLCCEIKFSKQEIRFLLGIITKQYTLPSISKETVKLLDTYWKEFEQLYLKFELIDQELKGSNNDHPLLEENLFLLKKNVCNNNCNLCHKYYNIVDCYNAVKASLYDYLERNISNHYYES